MSDVRGRMGTPFLEALWSRVHLDPQPLERPTGKSGYFSEPSPELDPRIVDPRTNKVWPELRRSVLATIYDFWRKRYRDPERWSTVWIAGSALSHQWSADRGTADLDILIGVDHAAFIRANPTFADLAPDVIDARFNKEFDNELEPFTKSFMGDYELTAYVNPGAQDIRTINPYAAYDLNHDRWTVPPIELGAHWDPESHFSRSDVAKVHAEVDRAKSIVGRYHELRRQAEAMVPGSPGWVNAVNAIRRTVLPQASALFGDIHHSRTLAFAPGGKGYLDFQNYRWQAHHRAGTADALHALKAMDVRAHVENQERLYGEPILGPDQALLQAELWNTPYRNEAVELPTTGPAAPQQR